MTRRILTFSADDLTNTIIDQMAQKHKISRSQYIRISIHTLAANTDDKIIRPQAQDALKAAHKSVIDDRLRSNLSHMTLKHNLTKKIIKLSSIIQPKEAAKLCDLAIQYATLATDKKMATYFRKLRAAINKKDGWQQVRKLRSLQRNDYTKKEQDGTIRFKLKNDKPDTP